MGITTKIGDKGNTNIMYGRVAPKHNLRVDAYGTVDELNAALGLIRAALMDNEIKKDILKIQKETFMINAELATTLYDDYKLKIAKKKIGQSHIDFLEQKGKDIEKKYDVMRTWSIPGENWNSALLELARTVCRRAERCVVVLDQNQLLENKLILKYLNRLSDYLWLLARKTELDSASSS